VSWNASTDTGGSGLKGYNLYRNGSFVKQVTTTSTSDTGLTASTIYSYAVSAVDNAGNQSAKSATASVNTPACTTSGHFQWDKQFGGVKGNPVNGYAVATDSSANVYAVGNFVGSVNFGSGTAVSSISGSQDVFLTKYSSSGAFQWAKHFGGSGYDSSAAIAVDSNNNLLVVGYFNGTASFGCAASLVTPGSYSDIFVAKYDPNGNCLWSKGIGGAQGAGGTGVAVDSSGNVYVAGTFYGTTDAASGSLTSAGGSDVYLAKYDGSGNLVWSKRFGGTNYDYSTAIAVDTSGNIYVTGYFYGTTDSSSGSLVSAGGSDVFLAKFNNASSLLWAKRFGGTGADNGYGIDVDSSGNPVITGAFSGTANFGGVTLTSTYTAMYLVKYDGNGNTVWAKSFDNGGHYGAMGRAVALDGQNNIAVVGGVSGAENFGCGTLADSSSGSYDIFFVKFNSLGQCIWSIRADYVWDDSGYGVCFDQGGDIFGTGYFYQGADLGGTPLSSDLVNAAFLVKFAP
jgi:hypothetical protein